VHLPERFAEDGHVKARIKSISVSASRSRGRRQPSWEASPEPSRGGRTIYDGASTNRALHIESPVSLHQGV